MSDPTDTVILEQGISSSGEITNFLPTNLVVSPEYYKNTYEIASAYYTMLFDTVLASDVLAPGASNTPLFGVFMLYMYYMQNPIYAKGKDGQPTGLITASDLSIEDKIVLITLHDNLMGLFEELLELKKPLDENSNLGKALKQARTKFNKNKENAKNIADFESKMKEHFQSNQNQMLLGDALETILVEDIKPDGSKPVINGDATQNMKKVLEGAKKLSKMFVENELKGKTELVMDRDTFDKINELYTTYKLPLLLSWDQFLMGWPFASMKFVLKSKGNNKNNTPQEVIEDAVDREVSSLDTAVYYIFVSCFVIRYFVDQYGENYQEIMPRVTVLIQYLLRENVAEETGRNLSKVKSEVNNFNTFGVDKLLSMYLGDDVLTNKILVQSPEYTYWAEAINAAPSFDPRTTIPWGMEGYMKKDQNLFGLYTGGGLLSGITALLAVMNPFGSTETGAPVTMGAVVPSVGPTVGPSYPMYTPLTTATPFATRNAVSPPNSTNASFLMNPLAARSDGADLSFAVEGPPGFVIPAAPSLGPKGPFFAINTSFPGYTTGPGAYPSSRPGYLVPPASTSTPAPYSATLASTTQGKNGKNGKQVTVPAISAANMGVQVQATPTSMPGKNYAALAKKELNQRSGLVAAQTGAIAAVAPMYEANVAIARSSKSVYSIRLAVVNALANKKIALEPQHLQLAYQMFSGKVVECGSACSYTFSNSAVAYSTFLSEPQMSAVQGVSELTREKVGEIQGQFPQFKGISQATSSSIVFDAWYSDIRSSTRWELGGKSKAFNAALDTNIKLLNAVDPNDPNGQTYTEVALLDIVNGGQVYALGNVTLVFQVSATDTKSEATRTGFQKVANAVSGGIDYVLTTFDSPTADKINVPPLVGWAVQFLKNNGEGKYEYDFSVYINEANYDVLSPLSRGFMMKQLPHLREALVNTPNLNPKLVDIRRAGLYGDPIFTMASGPLKDFLVAEHSLAETELKFDIMRSVDQFALSVNEYANHQDSTVSQMAIAIVTNVKRVQTDLKQSFTLNSSKIGDSVVVEYEKVFTKFMNVTKGLTQEQKNLASTNFKALAANVTNAILDPALNAGAGINAVYQSTGIAARRIGEKAGDSIESASDFLGLIIASGPLLFLVGAVLGFGGDFMGHAFDVGDAGLLSAFTDIWTLKNLIGPSLLKGIKLGIAGASLSVLPPVLSFGLVNSGNIETFQPFIVSSYVLTYLTYKFGGKFSKKALDCINTIKSLTRAKTQDEIDADAAERSLAAAERKAAAELRLRALGIAVPASIANRPQAAVPNPQQQGGPGAPPGQQGGPPAVVVPGQQGGPPPPPPPGQQGGPAAEGANAVNAGQQQQAAEGGRRRRRKAHKTRKVSKTRNKTRTLKRKTRGRRR
jgi:hypothetical protein